MQGSDQPLLSGLVEFLEGKPGVKGVKLTVNKPATSGEIAVWEESHHCQLPEDLGQFYLTNDGLTLHWNYLYNDTIVQLGRINIKSLSGLKQLGVAQSGHTSWTHPSLLDLEEDSDGSRQRPSFTQPCRVFPLDYCPSCGHTCLVYMHNTASQAAVSSIWLLDLSLKWYYLSSSFSVYLRLAVVHLGLLQWPYALTPNRLSPQYQRWFHMFIPKRLAVDMDQSAAPQLSDAASSFVTSLDISKLLQTRASKDRR